MNRAPQTLQVIRDDLHRCELASRQTDFPRLTPNGARGLLQRFYSIRRRANNCRFVFSSHARALRARILRRAFQAWRSSIRKMLDTATLRDWVVAHIRTTGGQVSIFDPNNWTIRLLCLEWPSFQHDISTAMAGVPLTAQQQPQDPYWRALKLNLSHRQL